ncbi:hypothetical protein [Halioxenophilus aromaticivorans]|uniref:hypothetical protein n=1 Tax=Halioxenophilus aromaticivorans TaxID=1306992 RepID=UPI0031E64C4F
MADFAAATAIAAIFISALVKFIGLTVIAERWDAEIKGVEPCGKLAVGFSLKIGTN